MLLCPSGYIAVPPIEFWCGKREGAGSNLGVYVCVCGGGVVLVYVEM